MLQLATVDAGGTPHYEFCTARNLSVYEYDPTDDGPEVEVITRITTGLKTGVRRCANGEAD